MHTQGSPSTSFQFDFPVLIRFTSMLVDSAFLHILRGFIHRLHQKFVPLAIFKKCRRRQQRCIFCHQTWHCNITIPNLSEWTAWKTNSLLVSHFYFVILLGFESSVFVRSHHQASTFMRSTVLFFFWCAICIIRWWLMPCENVNRRKAAQTQLTCYSSSSIYGYVTFWR